MASNPLPPTYARVLCVTQTTDFAKATVVDAAPATADLLADLERNPTHVLLRNRYLGINASDTNFVAGRYDPRLRPPYAAGFESIGEVVAVGKQVRRLRPGMLVGTMAFGAFAEYQAIAERNTFPLPAGAGPEYLGIMVNGLTAYLALHKATGGLRAGEVVLVTGAAGATGQIAVQVAKAAGCHVVGTCGSDDKAAALRAMGADRAINYKTEDVAAVLRAEYPKGVNVVFEGIGGKMLQAVLPNLAVRARLLIIGAVSTYDADGKFEETWSDRIPSHLLLTKSISATGFFLNHYASDMPEAWGWLTQTLAKGSLKVTVDPTPFAGLGQVKDAVAHLQAGKNVGKIVVDIGAPGASRL